jgi:signal transduction histidine kinase
VLEIPYPLLDKVDIWFRLPGNEIIHYRAGAEYAYSDRIIKSPSLAFPVPETDQDIDIVFSVQTSSLLTVSTLLWDKDAWQEARLLSRMWYGFLFGGIAILIIYNLFVASALKDISYIYYILYLSSITLVNAIDAGYADEFLWNETAGFSSRILLTVVASTTIFGLLFVNRFLDVRVHFPRLWKISVLAMFLVLPPVLPELLGYSQWNHMMIASILVITNLCMFYYLGIAIASYRVGIRQARFIIVAFSTFLAGFIFYQLFLFQGIEANILITHMLEAGTLTEGLLLSLALADRINLLTQKIELTDKQIMDSQTAFSKKIILTQEMERERFSNALHDSIGHGLLVLKQNLENIARQCGHGIPARKEYQHDIQQQAEYCSEILNDVKHMSHDLHPHILARLGLKAAIETTIEKAFSGTDIQWQTDIDDNLHGMDVEREITLYRVIQESLNNILKHAQASEVMFSLRQTMDEIIVDIKDDGIGFDMMKGSGSGLGLNTMHGRLKLFGGSLRVSSSPGDGAHLTICMPG